MEWFWWGFEIGAGIGGFFAGIAMVLFAAYFVIALVALAFGGSAVGLIELSEWIADRRKALKKEG